MRIATKGRPTNREKKQPKKCARANFANQGAQKKNSKVEKGWRIYQFGFGAGGLLAASFGFDLQLLLCERLQVLVALQLLFLFGAQHKHLVIVIVIAEVIALVRLVGLFAVAVIDRVLAELIDAAYQLCSG